LWSLHIQAMLPLNFKKSTWLLFWILWIFCSFQIQEVLPLNFFKNTTFFLFFGDFFSKPPNSCSVTTQLFEKTIDFLSGRIFFAVSKFKQCYRSTFLKKYYIIFWNFEFFSQPANESSVTTELFEKNTRFFYFLLFGFFSQPQNSSSVNTQFCRINTIFY